MRSYLFPSLFHPRRAPTGVRFLLRPTMEILSSIRESSESSDDLSKSELPWLHTIFQGSGSNTWLFWRIFTTIKAVFSFLGGNLSIGSPTLIGALHPPSPVSNSYFPLTFFLSLSLSLLGSTFLQLIHKKRRSGCRLRGWNIDESIHPTPWTDVPPLFSAPSFLFLSPSCLFQLLI